MRSREGRDDWSRGENSIRTSSSKSTVRVDIRIPTAVPQLPPYDPGNPYQKSIPAVFHMATLQDEEEMERELKALFVQKRAEGLGSRRSSTDALGRDVLGGTWGSGGGGGGGGGVGVGGRRGRVSSSSRVLPPLTVPTPARHPPSSTSSSTSSPLFLSSSLQTALAMKKRRGKHNTSITTSTTTSASTSALPLNRISDKNWGANMKMSGGHSLDSEF